MRRQVDAMVKWRYWMERADQARTMAEGFSNPEARETMLRFANEYEHMAKVLEPPPWKRKTAPERAE